MSDFSWSRLALSAGIQSLEQLALLLAALVASALVISCWRAWTFVAPPVRSWATIPDRLEPAMEDYGARQLIRTYPDAMMRGVGSAGLLHLLLAVTGLMLLSRAAVAPHEKSFQIIHPIPIGPTEPGPVVTTHSRPAPPPLVLPDPRKAIPSPVDRHLSLMDSADMTLAALADPFGDPFGKGMGIDGPDGPPGNKAGLGIVPGPPGDPGPDDFVAVEQLPELVWMTAPVYPELARQAEIEGVVEILVLVSRDGSVKTMRLARSIEALDQAALAAAATARFKPALWKGRAVAVWVSMPIQFRLD